MRVSLPALWALNEKTRIGYIKQILIPDIITDSTLLSHCSHSDPQAIY